MGGIYQKRDLNKLSNSSPPFLFFLFFFAGGGCACSVSCSLPRVSSSVCARGLLVEVVIAVSKLSTPPLSSLFDRSARGAADEDVGEGRRVEEGMEDGRGVFPAEPCFPRRCLSASSRDTTAPPFKLSAAATTGDSASGLLIPAGGSGATATAAAESPTSCTHAARICARTPRSTMPSVANWLSAASWEKALFEGGKADGRLARKKKKERKKPRLCGLHIHRFERVCMYPGDLWCRENGGRWKLSGSIGNANGKKVTGWDIR